MVVKSTPRARAMPGMDGRYRLMPSGLTAAIAMSNAIPGGLSIGCAAAAVEQVISGGSSGGSQIGLAGEPSLKPVHIAASLIRTKVVRWLVQQVQSYPALPASN